MRPDRYCRDLFTPATTILRPVPCIPYKYSAARAVVNLQRAQRDAILLPACRKRTAA
jgi:hypothetical protein